MKYKYYKRSALNHDLGFADYRVERIENEKYIRVTMPAVEFYFEKDGTMLAVRTRVGRLIRVREDLQKTLPKITRDHQELFGEAYLEMDDTVGEIDEIRPVHLNLRHDIALDLETFKVKKILQSIEGQVDVVRHFENGYYLSIIEELNKRAD